MQDENNLENNGGQENSVVKPEDNLLEAFNNLKNNSVSKDEYARVMELNKKLVESLTNNNSPTGEQEEPKLTSKEAKKNLEKALNEGATNLECWDKTLKYRKAVLDETGYDVFVGENPRLDVTQEDRIEAARTAEIMQQVVESADGNPDVFLSEFNRVVKNIPGASAIRTSKRK